MGQLFTWDTNDLIFSINVPALAINGNNDITHASVASPRVLEFQPYAVPEGKVGPRAYCWDVPVVILGGIY